MATDNSEGFRTQALPAVMSMHVHVVNKDTSTNRTYSTRQKKVVYRLTVPFKNGTVTSENGTVIEVTVCPFRSSLGVVVQTLEPASALTR